jgi:hypothetical protein
MINQINEPDNEGDRSAFTSLLSLINANKLLIAILIIALIAWALVFSRAVYDHLLRQRWFGNGSFNLFGFTIYVQFEGWSDYAHYYLTWGERFVDGYTPYTEVFEYPTPDRYVPFFLPPLYLYLCGLGYSLPFGPFGTALLICLFGFATAFPVYGISKYLTDNKRIAEVATGSYLLNPLILFHTTYWWLNPAPFVFFMMLSFYLLMKQRRLAGTLAMVTAAFFKQTAFLLALPLIAYLLKAPPSKEPADSTDENEKTAGDRLDILGFLKVTVIVLAYIIVLSFPYILNLGNYLYYIFLKPGMVLLKDISVYPPSNAPIQFAVLFIVIGAPDFLTQLINLATAYGLLLLIGVLIPFALMLIEVKDDQNLPNYWRRMMYLTLLLLLSLHIFSPRGIYKYYCVALIPFFVIMSGDRIISREKTEYKASFAMILNPLIMTLLILVPNRHVSIGLLGLIMVAYILHNHFGFVYEIFSEPISRNIRKVKENIPQQRRVTLIS